MSSDKKFLIRSSGHILGPFFKDEVIELIKQGKVSVFDEVAEPFSIWLYLQDHADFKKTVYSVSMQTRLVNFLSSVSTKISQISKNTDKKILTDIKTKTDTQRLSPLEKQSASEVSVESVKPIQPALSSKAGYQSETDSEQAVKKKITFFVRWSWKMVILAVLLIGAYIAYKEFYIPMQKKQTITADLKSEGLMFYKAGNFKSALPFFEQAYSYNILNDDEKILYSAMLIQNNNYSKAGVVKDELLNNPSFKQGKGVLLDSLLAYYNEDESRFTKQLESLIKSDKKELIKKTNSQEIQDINQDINRVIDTAHWNLALFYWKKAKYDQSIAYLNQLTTRGINRDIISYLKALNLLFQKKWADLEFYLTADTGGLDLKGKGKITEFKQELYLLEAYIYMKKQNKQSLDSQIIKLLNEDPFLHQQYSYNPFVIKDILFNWSYLYSWCREIVSQDPDNNLLKALYAFCAVKANKLKAAEESITQAISAEPKNPLFLALNSYLKIKKDEGKQKIETIFSNIKYKETILPLPFILKARFLERQEEWQEALSTWRQLLAIEPNSLSGIAETAFTNYQLENNIIGDSYRKKALKKYPYYIKLLPYKK